MPWEFKSAITALVVLIACYALDRKFRKEIPDALYGIVAIIGTVSFFAIPLSLLVALWRLA